MEKNKAAILVAEDRIDDGLLIVRSFRKIGVEHPVHVVEDGVVAKAYLAGEPPFTDRDIYPEPTFFLLDVRMNRCDGFELLAHLKADPRWAGLPTFFLSSSADPAHVSRAREMGATGFHAKPYAPSELEDLLRSLRHHWESHPSAPRP